MKKRLFLSIIGVIALCCLIVVAGFLYSLSLSSLNNAKTSTPLNATSQSSSNLQNTSSVPNNSSTLPSQNSTTTPTPQPTVLTLNLPTTAKAYQKVTISSVLTDSNHQPISGQHVYYIIVYNLGHGLIGGGNTDNDGFTSTSFEFAPAGNYTVQAVYSGRSGYFPNSPYSGSSDTKIISITPKLVSGISATTLSIFASNNKIPMKSTIQLGATLKDNSGDPIPNEPLVFQFSTDNITWILFKTVNTGVYGNVEFDYTPNQTGNLIIRAIFDGDTNYYPSKVNVIITVT